MEKIRAGPVIPHGKQSVKQLVGQNQGVANIEITDSNIKDFERVARKYGVDFALKKDRSGEVPKYLVFFKARDADALTAAFKEYTAKTDRKKERPSVMKLLRKLKAMDNGPQDRTCRRKEICILRLLCTQAKQELFAPPYERYRIRGNRTGQLEAAYQRSRGYE